MYDIDDSELGKKKDHVTVKKLEKYFKVTGKALEMARAAVDKTRIKEAMDFLDMASRYYSDAGHFRNKNEYVLALSALNYAHGWLDAGARIKLFDVHDSTIFTVDDE